MLRQWLLAVLVLCVVLDLVAGGSRNRNGSRGGRNGNPRRGSKPRCRYSRVALIKDRCTRIDQIVVANLTPNSNNAASCNQTREVKYNCSRACKYKKLQFTACNTTTLVKSGVAALKNGPSYCAAEKSINKVCAGGQGCRYRPSGNWSQCDNTTLTMTRTLTLKNKNPNCEQTKQATKKCKLVCKYKKGAWSVCHPTKHQKSRTDALKPHSAGTCPPTRIINRKCKKEPKAVRPTRPSKRPPRQNGGRRGGRRPQGKRQGRRRMCQFTDWGEFGECQNGVQTQLRRVISGPEEICQRKATNNKPC